MSIEENASGSVVTAVRGDGNGHALKEAGGERKNGESATGLSIGRHFTKPGENPFDGVEWDYRSAIISGEKGEVVFEQKEVEIPKSWSQLATNVVVSKYFRGLMGAPKRENSVRHMINRITETLTEWGRKHGYFTTEEDAQAFYDELTHIILHQRATFNSPVWFNVGVEEKPQASACFILAVDDSMESILEWCKTEGMIFKGGSGSGVNLSKIRSSREHLSAGGQASGPISFMRAADSVAGSIKSGGKTRRAAKMVVLNVDHPDIVDFIWCKANEEKKAYALGDAGWDMSLNGDAWSSIQFQNANNSVRVTQAFLDAVKKDWDWPLKAITSGKPIDTLKARDMMKWIAEAAWQCGDPGMQYDTTINDWHTCANTDRINASNPCSEYMHLDNSACNLASINLLRYLTDDETFDVEAFKHTVDIVIMAQDIIVNEASYPTEKIGINARAFRQLGLGYANLGALLMAMGLPYDSDGGRACAGAITALMTGRAYRQSALLAEHLGPFEGYAVNREPMLRVIKKHRKAVDDIDARLTEPALLDAARTAWNDAVEIGEKYGYKNSQTSVLAPTGTIAFMMDCDTTGIEPDIALVKYKRLVGGGTMKIVNRTVESALKKLGYTPEQITAIEAHIGETGTIEGTPELKPEHLPVFDSAFRAEKGVRSIHYMGHIKMMAAAQPFISGAISKTVNLPNEATADDVMNAYLEGGRLGLKALAIYRDGSKRTQPLSTKASEKKEPEVKVVEKIVEARPVRRRLPDERQAITHKFSIAGHEGYLTVGLFEDGTPGEIFLRMSKEGSTVSGMMDAFATAISVALQYGVPLESLVRKFSHMRFEPAGFTGSKEVPIAKSIMDYIFRWLAIKFLPKESQPGQDTEETTMTVAASPATHRHEAQEQDVFVKQADAPSCPDCGSLMTRNGTCYVCRECGTTSGCS
ncbi:MAG: vitamin B12-dependent ribonucleotide reductase [candidate division Zixibacteria bacterium]|nr:vitamin B12-dependent ribonucleotide reductase [candidate division Zixibacteria bacterium]